MIDSRQSTRGLSSVRFASLAIFALLVSGASLSAPATAQQAGIEAGRDALRSGGYPWYDKESDGVRSTELRSDQTTFEGRKSDWERNNNTPAGPRANAKISSTLANGLQVLVWVFGGLMLAAFIWGMIYYFLRASEQQRQPSAALPKPRAPQPDRVEELPVPIDAAQGDLWEQARRHYQQGNLRDAVICLFSYQLIQLDNRHLIHLERGKTNRQYLREITPHPQLKSQLEGTMVAFEDVFFGDHELTPKRFEICWNSVEQFRQRLAAGGQA